MQISNHVHALKIPFKIIVAEDNFLDRFVYVYIILGDKICLVDSGVSGAHERIFEYLASKGRSPEDISTLVITHAHPDHIGSALRIKELTGCTVAAHVDAKPWIEDIELQFNERPVPGFHNLVDGSVKVDKDLSDGSTINIANDMAVNVIHTPGHSNDSISLLFEADSVLITADLIPVIGEMPIYEDILESVKSIRKLMEIPNIKVLLSAWDEPKKDGDALAAMDTGIRLFQGFHSIVRMTCGGTSSKDPQFIAQAVVKALGLHPSANNPLFFRTVAAHIEMLDREIQ